MTRVVNRLERQGLVQRAKCQEDLRGWNAVLTDDGLARLQEASPASRRPGPPIWPASDGTFWTTSPVTTSPRWPPHSNAWRSHPDPTNGCPGRSGSAAMSDPSV
ncbi:MarR family winged helix-turn-helix transcriptional regulator [Streptomyces sp. NBC_01483]|uniref:MarR family winged helix-turn-helix transcriptional regulator n=1 Tax=Streptomyces sp. NBC_01483 TaxID=2903883 RepID=UPI003FCD9D43